MIPDQEMPDLEVNGGTAVLFANWKPYEVEYNVLVQIYYFLSYN